MYVYILQYDGRNTRFHFRVRIKVSFEVTVTPNPRHHRDYPGRHTAGGQAGGTSAYRYSDCQNSYFDCVGHIFKPKYDEVKIAILTSLFRRRMAVSNS